MTRRVAVGSLAIVLCAQGALAAGETFQVDQEHSQVVIHVGRAGLLGFVGHTHEVLAPRITGEIQVDAADLAACSVWLRFAAAALRVSGRGEPPEDVPKVQERMLGPDVLAVSRFPSVDFRSTRVEGRRSEEGSYELRISGVLELHGTTRTVTVPAHASLSEGVLRVEGRLTLAQRDYGMTPVSVGGVIKVKNELEVAFSIAAVAASSVSEEPRP